MEPLGKACSTEQQEICCDMSEKIVLWEDKIDKEWWKRDVGIITSSVDAVEVFVEIIHLHWKKPLQNMKMWRGR